MTIQIQLPEYDGSSVDIIWENGSEMTLHIVDEIAHIAANKQGLISLAKQMLYLATQDLPTGSHVHLDGFFTQCKTMNTELVIEKIDSAP